MSGSRRRSQAGLASTVAAELRAVCGKLKRRLREQGRREELTQSQVSVILRLEKDGPATVSSLARAEGMRPQSMSAVVAPMQESGLVRGLADPNDGRQTLISLTPKCMKRLRAGREARQDWLSAKITQKLSAREQRSLRAALVVLARLVED